MAFSSADKYLGWISNVSSDPMLRLFSCYIDLAGKNTHARVHADTSIHSHTHIERHRQTERQTEGTFMLELLEKASSSRKETN